MRKLSRRTRFLKRSPISTGLNNLGLLGANSGATNQVIELADGDPEFPTPSSIMIEGIRALEEGHTHYIEIGGLVELREAILDRMGWSTFGYDSIDKIVITPGSKFALYASLSCIIDPGDKVMIIDPSWAPFDSMVRLTEGIPIHISTKEEGRFLPSLHELEENVTKELKAIIINSPNNPTGRVYDHAEIEMFLDFARNHNLVVISDEIYRDVVFDVPHVSAADFPDFRDWVLIVDSFSKSHAMPGWRLGYILGDEHLMEKIAQFQQHTVTCAPSISQYAIYRALISGVVDEAIVDVVEEYRIRREKVLLEIGKVPGLRLSAMEGAFYAWIDVGEVTKSSNEFSNRLFEEYGVSVVPGLAFGSSGEGYVRLCYARASRDKLTEGLSRIKACAANW